MGVAEALASQPARVETEPKSPDFVVRSHSGRPLCAGTTSTAKSPYWPPEDYRVVASSLGNLDGDPELEVVLLASHSKLYPGMVVICDLDGKVLCRYWHPGQPSALLLHDADNDGASEVYVGATNNDASAVRGKATPAVFCVDVHSRGEAPPRRGRIGKGRERWYRLLDRRAAGSVATLAVEGSWLLWTTRSPRLPQGRLRLSDGEPE